MTPAVTRVGAGPVDVRPADLLAALGAFGGLILVAFLVGAVNPAAIFARALRKDLRGGSGNPGATNAGRVLGVRWGVVVGVLDVLKGLVPTLLALRVLGLDAAYLVGLAAVLGHIYSPFLKGHGGKGVATALGAVLAVHPYLALAMVLVFGVVLAVGRWVAGASLAAAAALAVLGVLGQLGLVPGGFERTGWWALTLSGIVWLRHVPNLRAWVRRRRLRD